MSFRRKNHAARAEIKTALLEASSDLAKDLTKKLGLKPASQKKTDAVAALIPFISTTEQSFEIFQMLDNLQQNAVSEAVFNKDLEFDSGRFFAKYGAHPAFLTKKDYRNESTLLALFIYADAAGEFIPKDLAHKLKPAIPRPKGFVLKTTEKIPKALSVKNYRQGKNQENSVTLIVRETEGEAQQDFFQVLRLIEAKQVAVSDKTLYPSGKSIEEITTVLQNGDFYEEKTGKKVDQPIGPIKAFAWAMILQASKLTSAVSKKLVLSNEGRKILSESPHEIIKNLWQKWQKTTILDEFSRIDEIKGQHRQGKSSLTPIKPRRESIADSFQLCPVGEWISIDEFFRCVRLNFNFTVAHEEWDLYIEDSNYGSLGYEYSDDFDKWPVLEGRYILAVLFEYAATLGLIDVAYIPPARARDDYCELWGTEDLEFLSRYDGLKFIRINNLGAYCFDLKKEYKAPEIAVKSSLTVLPDLRIKVAGEPLTGGEELFLEGFAEKETAGAWRLSREKMINALENGQKIAALNEFLSKREEQFLPEIVEGFMRDTEKRAGALQNKGTAQIIECETAEIADEIAENPHMKKLCQRVGKASLAILENDVKKFKEMIRKIGYGMK